MQRKPQPAHALERDPTDHEDALLDMLGTTPNVMMTMVLLVSCGIGGGYNTVSPWFLVPWSLAAAISAIVRHVLNQKFKRLDKEQINRHRKQWLLFARHAPTVHAAIYASLVLCTFPYISQNTRIVISLVGSGMLVGAVGFSALAGRPMLYLLLLSSAAGWLLFGGELAGPVGGICLAALVMYIPARSNQAARAIERVRLNKSLQKVGEELAQRNAELAQRERDKTLLLATASHDLRQPVHALGLILENMRRMQPTPAQDQRLQVAQSRLELLSDMLHSILEISQMDLGTYPVHSEPTPILELIKESISPYLEPVRQKSLHLNTQLQPIAGWQIDTDRGLLGRILINLISNAVKYTEQGTIVDASGKLSQVSR